MDLENAARVKAILSRDTRFSGRFFVGVVTTRVYCRPGCPAPLPKAKNMRFYTYAAAAEDAGFRPCRRCRPETAPGSPVWDGTSATVSRALKTDLRRRRTRIRGSSFRTPRSRFAALAAPFRGARRRISRFSPAHAPRPLRAAAAGRDVASGRRSRVRGRLRKRPPVQRRDPRDVSSHADASFDEHRRRENARRRRECRRER